MARVLLIEAILSCDTLETLNLFACSNLWKIDKEVFEAIVTRHDQLTCDIDPTERYFFGNEDYYMAYFGEFDFPDTAEEMTHDIFDSLPIQIGHGQEEPSQQENVENFYEMSDFYRERIRRFQTEGKTYKMKFKNLDEADITSIGTSVFKHVLDRVVTEDSNSDVRVGLCIRHISLERPVLIPFRRRKEITSESLMREFERVQQSVKALQFDEALEITITTVIPPSGAGIKKGAWKPWFDRLSNHGGCLIQIRNSEDNLCLARAVVTAKARYHKDDSPAAKSFYRSVVLGDRQRMTRQREEAISLMQLAGLEDHEGSCGLDQIQKVQDVLPEYQLKVYWKEMFNSLLYKGPEKDAVLSLYYHNNHFTVISSVAAFFGFKFYCHQCEKAFKNKDDHQCSLRCSRCFRFGKDFPCHGTENIRCPDCNMFFNNQSCFDEHKKVTNVTIGGPQRRKIATSICRRIWRCEKCSRVIYVKNLKGEKHQCGSTYCCICHKYLPSSHCCFMQKIMPRKNAEAEKQTEKVKFIFWDFETRQETEIGRNAQGPIMRHVVNYCVVMRACDQCWKTSIETDCVNCGKRQHLFSGDECLDHFCSWLFTEENKSCTVLAHNMSGFDGQFLLDWLHKNAIKPELVLKGLSIMLLKTATVTIKCSLNFLPMRLADFPKAFNLKEQKKGFYPFLFNTKANEHYVGPYPPIEDYCVDQMKSAARSEFLKWYQEKVDSGAVFDQTASLRDYCISDVRLLMDGCMTFREEFMTATTVDPFVSASTIAGSCSYVYRKLFLPENTIPLIPEGGYRREQKQSAVAIKWMKWLEESEGWRIKHKLNGGEERVPGTNFRVDGFIDRSKTNQRPLALEFHGCCWHGCRKCYIDRQKKLPNGLTASEAYLRTIDRRLVIEHHFDVLELWECDLKIQLRANKQMKKFFDECEVVDVLDPRGCLYGGRTGATRLWHETAPDETVKYIDICSLYPYIMVRGKFPIKEPQIITQDFETLTEHYQPYRGLMKVTVLPPKKLYHPLLPRRVNKKLLFSLCRVCSDKQLNETCTHSDEERQFTGDFTSMEVTKALQLGYKVIKVYEVWHWDENSWMCYDQKDPATGLFTSYIHCFLKLKAEASGFPPGVDTDELKDKYIQEYFDREGIQLEKEKIEYSSGRRNLSKLCLNSLWGKFAQRQSQTRTEYFKDPAAYYKLVCDEANEVFSVKAVNEEMVVVNYQKKEGWVAPLPNVNVVLGVFTTAQARLHLYSYLEQLGKRVFYFDTDSIVYITRPTDTYHPEIGSYLGMMVSELPPGWAIKRWVAGGAKQYAYQAESSDGKQTNSIMKIRGFTLGYDAEKKLHFDSMKRMVLAIVNQNDNSDAVTLTFPQICRLSDHSVVTKIAKKTYRPVFNKRRILKNFDSLPFGYVD